MFSRRDFAATRLQTRLITALVFIFLLLLEGYCSASVCRVSKDEQTIYSTIVGLSEGEVAIIDPTTENVPVNLGEYLEQDLYRSLYPKLSAAGAGETIILSSPGKTFDPLPRNVRIELQSEFDSHLEQPCQISVGTHSLGSAHLESSRTINHIFSSGDLNQRWKIFHHTFGQNAVLYRFSRVAFDSSKNYALLHVSTGSGAMAGCGELYLLKKAGANWSIQHQWLTWTT